MNANVTVSQATQPGAGRKTYAMPFVVLDPYHCQKNTPLPPVSPAEQQERKRKLMTITQAEYQQLLNKISVLVPRSLCDPAEALSEGFIIAMRKYNGMGQWTVYIVKCAYYYALEQYKKRRRQICFTDLQDDDELDEYLDAVLPYLQDPRYVEAVDELFIQRIEEILDSIYDYRFRYSTRQAITDAHRLLMLLRENANLGKGIGVDEYEHGPLSKPYRGKQRPGRRLHNTTFVRQTIVEHLCEEFQTDKRNIFSAMKALRISTRQALNEGWLPD